MLIFKLNVGYFGVVEIITVRQKNSVFRYDLKDIMLDNTVRYDSIIYQISLFHYGDNKVSELAKQY